MAKKQYDGPKSVGALWRKESGKGTKYFSMVIEHPDDPDKKINYVVFKNENKKKDEQPDYRVLLSKPFDKKKSKSRDDDDEDEDTKFDEDEDDD